MSSVEFATPIRALIEETQLPLDFLTAPDGAMGPVLDKLFFTDYAVLRGPDGVGAAIDLVIAQEAALALPGLDGFAFVFGGDGSGATLVRMSVLAGASGITARLDDVTV